ncbi:MAG: hypothetical protein EBU90_18320 [Proteobacteria bacterium]|nr:hypothetical protein [Pseudomonadota bacterium]NBP14335.1 hypothetical protein [bacterium]
MEIIMKKFIYLFFILSLQGLSFAMDPSNSDPLGAYLNAVIQEVDLDLAAPIDAPFTKYLNQALEINDEEMNRLFGLSSHGPAIPAIPQELPASSSSAPFLPLFLPTDHTTGATSSTLAPIKPVRGEETPFEIPVGPLKAAQKPKAASAAPTTTPTIYRCRFCAKTFAEELTMKQHMKTHNVNSSSGEKVVLKSPATGAESCLQPAQSSFDKRIIKCKECPATFATPGGLHQHITKMHKNEVDRPPLPAPLEPEDQAAPAAPTATETITMPLLPTTLGSQKLELAPIKAHGLTTEQEIQNIEKKAQQAALTGLGLLPRRRAAAQAQKYFKNVNNRDEDDDDDGDDDDNDYAEEEMMVDSFEEADDDDDGKAAPAAKKQNKGSSHKKNVCHICYKSFPWPNVLENHIKQQHSEDRPFSCDFPECSKSFKTDRALKAHQRNHDPSKLKQCTVEGCRKAFRTKYLLNNHIRTHTGEKPYKCLLCPKSFPTTSNLNTHIRNKHNEEPAEGDNKEIRVNTSNDAYEDADEDENS